MVSQHHSEPKPADGDLEIGLTIVRASGLCCFFDPFNDGVDLFCATCKVGVMEFGQLFRLPQIHDGLSAGYPSSVYSLHSMDF